ncbi:hypothetical protein C1645_778588 [Glomus cerebriforme]|uniref:Uncharacterized protein n=1 Tax=Glomus cerebriforme TaxID=658196 RepID=A0A397SSC1_9GLOM|nr:hypothetical protein C1645_778588 [Glomus cerebriforme]
MLFFCNMSEGTWMKKLNIITQISLIRHIYSLYWYKLMVQYDSGLFCFTFRSLSIAVING